MSAPGGVNAADPLRASAVDLGAVAVLAGCGLVGFRPVFGGIDWLIAGSGGIVAGLVVAWFGALRRLGVLMVGALTLAAYAVLSGVTAPSETSIRGIPSVDSVTLAFRMLGTGWKSLITTRPPVGSATGLLAIPLVCCLAAVVLSASAALRTRGVFRPFFPLLVLLVVSILLGVDSPASLAVQGALFLGVAVAWMAWRHQSRSTPVPVSNRSRRWASGLALIGISCLVAGLVGGTVPGASANPRFILRDQTDPPFDPRIYPSPLAGYRQYSSADAIPKKVDQRLFTITGADHLVDPKTKKLIEPIQLAVLDRYDGVVWNVAGAPNAHTETSGVFRQVGENQPPAKGLLREVHYTIKIGPGYRDVWLPTIGHVTKVNFWGARGQDLAASWRFNRTTDTGVVQQRFQPGDTVALESQVVAQPPPPAGSSIAAGVIDLGPKPPLSDELIKLAKKLTDGSSSASDRMLALQKGLHGDPQFGFSNGDAREKIGQPVAPGHSVDRLQRFASEYFDQSATFGNGEQYASAAALMGASLELPTRVVMGFCLDACPVKHGEIVVTGKDVAAWTEVYLAGLGWTRYNSTPEKDKRPPAPKPTNKPQSDVADQPPPPPPVTRPLAEPPTTKSKTRKKSTDAGSAFGIPVRTLVVGGIALSPFILVGTAIGSILVLKRRRRDRRRSTGTGRERVAGGWSEIADLAVDLGRPFPRQATRREAAGLLPAPEVQRVAGLADAAVFGVSPPSPESVEYYWSEIESARGALLAPLRRLDRFRASINPSSLRGHRPMPSNPSHRAKEPSR